MYTDAQLRPSNAQSLTGAGATTVSTNTVDLLSANTNLGVGAMRRGYVIASTAFTGGTNVKVEYIQSAAADLSSPDVLATGATIADASATIGAVLFDQVLPANTKRYVGYRYTTTGTHTTGAVSAFFLTDVDHQPYYPANTGF